MQKKFLSILFLYDKLWASCRKKWKVIFSQSLNESDETLPIEVSDLEYLARATFHPYHVSSKGKLKAGAFKAPPARDDVSVNRTVFLDGSACKEKAREIGAKTREEFNNSFKGFAIIVAKKVRDFGSEVTDTREICYLGHADIIHGIVIEKGEPAPPEFNKRLSDMAKAALFIPDPSPESDEWEGEELPR